MQRKEPKVSWETYHRIYRLGLKNIEPERIAETLKLPTRAVVNVLEKMFGQKHRPPESPEDNATEQVEESTTSYLDIFVLPKIRYVRMDFFGSITKETIPQLQTELDKISESQFKAVAFRMKDVIALDEEGLNVILDFNKMFVHRGRYAAILDPSLKIEPFITEKQVELTMPVFGTEKTFEDTAFAISRQQIRK